MTVTRANLEAILVQRCGALMSFAGMAVTVAGSNASLNDPIGYALRQVGYTVASHSSVSDADCASITDDYLDQVLDLAELRTLESVLGNLDDVDITNGPESERFSQLAVSLEKRITRLQDKINYTYGSVVAEMGYLLHDFAEHNDSGVGEDAND